MSKETDERNICRKRCKHLPKKSSGHDDKDQKENTAKHEHKETKRINDRNNKIRR